MLRIAMDSGGDMPLNWIEKFDVQVIPINIHFGEQVFLQGVNLTNEGFYRLVDESGSIPKTSQPTPHQFVEFYRRIADLGDTILSIHLTKKLSGTYASAEIAVREVEDEFNVIPFDSGGGSAIQGYMCCEARDMERKGYTIKEILDRLAFIRSKTGIILTLDTLDYARMSGRVKTLQAALASVLNVKPIVVLRDGILDMSEKVRTRRRSIERILEATYKRVGDQLVNAAVVHARDIKTGRELLERVRTVLNCKQVMFTELSIGIAANLGPGTVGIVAYPVAEG